VSSSCSCFALMSDALLVKVGRPAGWQAAEDISAGEFPSHGPVMLVENPHQGLP